MWLRHGHVVFKSSIFVVQKPTAPKNGVKFRQGSIGTIRSSLATSYDVWRRRQFSTNQRPRNYLRYTDTQTHKHRINILSGPALRAAPAKKRSHYLAPQWWQVVHYSAPKKIWWHNLHCSAPWGKILFGGSTYIIRHVRYYFSKHYLATLDKIIL